MDDPTTTTVERDEAAPAAASTAATDPGTDGVDEELLVEEVSIDGMCGVY